MGEMRINCSEWYQLPLLTGRSHHFHHILSVKGWVATAASLLEICRGEKKKENRADHHTSHTQFSLQRLQHSEACVSPQAESLINLCRYN